MSGALTSPRTKKKNKSLNLFRRGGGKKDEIEISAPHEGSFKKGVHIEEVGGTLIVGR